MLALPAARKRATADLAGDPPRGEDQRKQSEGRAAVQAAASSVTGEVCRASSRSSRSTAES